MSTIAKKIAALYATAEAASRDEDASDATIGEAYGAISVLTQLAHETDVERQVEAEVKRILGDPYFRILDPGEVTEY